MTAPAPEKCDVCGEAPLELVLYPIAIHYKGSGFYSTDYGKGRPAKKDGDASGDSSSKSDSSKGDSSKGDVVEERLFLLVRRLEVVGREAEARYLTQPGP